MKLRTSFFNFRVLLKNLTRFAPLWVLYAVGEVLGLMMLDLENAAGQIANGIANIMGPAAFFHAGYGLLVAACLFGDLFDTRMCNGLHAMPMRREGWMLTNLLSGLVFALIPAVVGGGVAALFLEQQWWIALVWQGVSLLQFVCFFGLAVFSAMCAGKRLGMFAVYGILNFLSMLVYWIVDNIFVPLLHGVVTSDYWFAKLCPLVSIMGSTYVDYGYDNILGGSFRGFVAEDWYYLYICAGVGVVFALLSWLLYRKRHLEKAGDFIAFRPMGKFFLLTYTLALGVMLYSYGDVLGLYKNYAFLAVGILIGWFTGWMLLERTVKVFTAKTLLGFVTFVIFFAGSMVATLLDPMGISVYIPQTEQITSANLYMEGDVYYYESDQGVGWQITDPEEIAWVQQIHSTMLDTSLDLPDEQGVNYSIQRLKYRLRGMEAVNGPDYEYISVNIRYRLHNGRELYRAYKVPVEGQLMEDLRQFFSDPRALLNVDDWEQVKANTQEIVVYQYDKEGYTEILTDTQRQALFAAIEADCEAGNLVQHGFFHKEQNSVAGIDITWDSLVKEGQFGEISALHGYHIVVYADSVNTLEFLKTLPKS